MRRALGLTLVMTFGCTEPNPFANDTDGTTASSTAGPETNGSDPTTASTTPGSTTASSDPTTDTTTGTTTLDPTEDTSTVGETMTGEPVCAHTCVALPPGDWEGPVAVLHDAPDDPEPACEGDFDTLVTTAFANLDAPAAQCDCDCEDPAGAACSQVTVVTDDASNCATPAYTWNFGTSCNNSVGGVSGSQTEDYWQATAEIDDGSCDPIENFTVPASSFGDRYTSCAQATIDTAGCDPGDACVAAPQAPYDGRLCIWHSGDQQCPTDIGYGVRAVYYGDHADDRACSTCTCGDVEGECTGSVGLWSVDSCPAQAPALILTIGGSCAQLTGGAIVSSADVSGALTPEASASCTPSDSQAIGEAEGIEPVTFCCDA